MRFAEKYLTKAFKTLTGFCLLSGFLLAVAPAEAFLGLGKKEEAIEAIPPVIQHSPTINNGNHAREPKKPDDAPPLVKPDAIGPRAVILPLDPTQTLIDQGIYPERWKERQTALTRAELAEVLVKALKHNTQMVSEFPFFRDVGREHPGYDFIEVARAKKLIEAQDEQGFYYPDREVTVGEVFDAIAQAITGKPPNEEETSFYLVIYPDWEEVPEELWPTVAKMTRARFFEEQESPALALSEEATPEVIAPFIVSLSHLNERRTILPPHKEELLPYIPGGLPIAVAPSVAIFEARLAVGEQLDFSLVEAVDKLPKGSKLRGVVVDIPVAHTYVVELTEAETPEEVIYRVNAEFEVVFRNKALPFVVPGEAFQTVTKPPSSLEAPKAPPPFAPPGIKGKLPPTLLPQPARPAGSSSNKAAPSSARRSSK